MQTKTIIKTCKKCKEEKSAKDFPRHKQMKDRLDTRCRSCIRKAAAIRRELYAKHGPKSDECVCCGSKDKKIVLDHDHKTGEFRGWICEPCNLGLGQLGDNLEGVLNAVKYLETVAQRCNINRDVPSRSS